jgi:hypothetical protein
MYMMIGGEEERRGEERRGEERRGEETDLVRVGMVRRPARMQSKGGTGRIR